MPAAPRSGRQKPREGPRWAAVAGGERIRIISFDGPWSETWLPREDFWLFDDATVVHMSYDPDGRFVDGEIETGPAIVLDRVNRKLVALNASRPLSEYLHAHPELHA